MQRRPTGTGDQSFKAATKVIFPRRIMLESVIIHEGFLLPLIKNPGKIQFFVFDILNNFPYSEYEMEVANLEFYSALFHHSFLLPFLLVYIYPRLFQLSGASRGLHD